MAHNNALHSDAPSLRSGGPSRASALGAGERGRCASHKTMRATFAAALVFCIGGLAGCAAALNPAAEAVNVVTANQKEQCRSLGIVSTEHRFGQNKPHSAMNKALNEVARRGGNALYVISTNLATGEGASVIGEALSCTAK